MPNLDLGEVWREIAANIREVMHADAVAVSLHDPTSGKARVFAIDCRHGKGNLKEELLLTPSAAAKRAFDTLKPVVIDALERDELSSEAYDIVAVEGIKALCAIPLVNHGRALGIMSVSPKTETPITSDGGEFLSPTS